MIIVVRKPLSIEVSSHSADALEAETNNKKAHV
jgi:hypothetical protein